MANDRGQDSIDYQALAEFRYHIRKFLRFSERAAREAGVEPQQHQLLLAVKGLPPDVSPTIGEIAQRLHVVHHSAVELVDRLEEQGMVQRRRSSEDRRRVLLSLTPKGERVLRELSVHHRRELEASGRELSTALRKLLNGSVLRDGHKSSRPKSRQSKSSSQE
jgi:DNA-binding MarR family transcriptional regulator